MQKILLILFLLVTCIFADVHYAKLEPIESITIKSEVSGKVTIAKKSLEGKTTNGLIVKIDDKLDKIDLNHSLESLNLITKMIKVNQDILPQLKKSYIKKRELYLKVAPLSSSSVSQKESLYSSFIGAKSQYSGTLEKILNLKNQKVSLKQKIALLKNKISKKNISVKNRYLYSLNVKKGEFVNIGMPLATIQDLSKAKLTIFLTDEELQNIDNKKILIDNKESKLKFNKIWKVADKTNISSYKAEIILKPFTNFSKLIKVEIK